MNINDLLKMFNITYDELLERHVEYINCDMMIVVVSGHMYKIYENKQVKLVDAYE